MTGGCGGIGRAICARFMREGAIVFAADLTQEGTLSEPSVVGRFVRFDVTSHPGDPLRAALPLLLAASWFLLVTSDHADKRPEVWFAVPPARECLVQLIAS